MSDSGDITRRITITATGQNIDSTTDSVTALGDAFDNTSQKASDSSWLSAVTSIAGVGVAAVGALAGIKGFIDYVGKQSEALADLSEHAAIAGMSVEQFQDDMYAAMSKGVSQDDFSSGMDKIASDLVAASQGTTQFTKLLEANGMAIKDNEGDIISVKTALSDVMTLMNGASPAVQQKIASIVGLTSDWVPFLREGTAEFKNQQQAAADLGIILDQSTVEKAKEFSDEWHTATAAWSMQFQAALGGILPQLETAAGYAIQMINGIGSFSSDVGRLFTAPENMSSTQLEAQIASLEKYQALAEQVSTNSSTAPSGESMGFLQWALGLPAGATFQDVDSALDKAQDLLDEKNSRLRVTPNNTPSTTQLAPNSDANALSRTEDQLTKRIGDINAETDAIDQNAGAQAAAKAQADLQSAAQKAGITDLDAYKDKWQDLTQDIEESTNALNAAKIASQIKFDNNTALMTPQDVQIATQLKTLYPDVTTAINSAEASQLRMIGDVKTLSTTAESAFGAMGADIRTQLQQGATLWQAFADAGANALNKIADKLSSMAADKLWESAFGGTSASGLLSFFGIGGSGTALSAGSAIPGAFGATSVGGSMGPMPLVGMYASGTDSAPGGWSIVGEKGPELMNVPKGAQILPNGTMPGGSTNASVTVNIDATGADSEGLARVQQQIANLQKTLPVTIVSTVKNAKQRNVL